MGDFNLDGLEVHFDSLAIGLSELGENLSVHLLPMAEKLDSIFNPHHRDASRDSLVRAYRDSVRAQRENQPRSVRGLRRDGVESQFSEEEILEEIDKLHAELKQTVMEYGPTLRSLPNDEMLIITLNWSGRHTALPQRSELRIRKSDLLDGAEPEIQVIERK